MQSTFWSEYPRPDALGRNYPKQHTPPPVIVENVGILNRGDDEEIKLRVHWYITFHPAIFDTCSKRGWEYPQ